MSQVNTMASRTTKDGMAELYRSQGQRSPDTASFERSYQSVHAYKV